MKKLEYILIFIILMILCFLLYIYVKAESFIDSTPVSPLISSQLISAIANVVGVSPRRISNLIFNGDISKKQLNVSFIILEANLSELSKNEMKAVDVTNFSNGLFDSGNFIITINDQSVLLNKIQPNNTPETTKNFFNNTSLITIANYANNKYISVPNDASYTNFYKLNIDNKYNIKPNLITIPNTASFM